jgi:glycosyltransferase involved in cell wall biosynthesis
VRVLLTADHRYPASRFPARGDGRASARLLDLLARGLAELGHDVAYALAGGIDAPLPDGVVAATERSARDTDVVHHQRLSPYERGDAIGRPWVRTIHTDLTAAGYDRARLAISDQWIYVSRALASLFGSTRVVRNGVDPSELVYSATKGDELLFVGSLDRAWEKGLDVALDLADATGWRLVIAGSASNAAAHARVVDWCRGRNARRAGEVSGAEKAELFAKARALVAPSRAHEAFGLVCVEALMSGTPVLCSGAGALPEIVAEGTGFICGARSEWLAAAEKLDAIDPARCRAYALQHFHYRRMAEDYVAEYEAEIRGSMNDVTCRFSSGNA